MDEKRRLIAQALVTYADACTLPALTPSCPFYSLGPDGPSCKEQCRDAAAQYGAGQRPKVTVEVGGLRMHGRVLPLSAVAGVEEYDAARSFLQDRDKPAQDRSTSALLLGLRAVLMEHGLTGVPSRTDEALEIWGALEKRIPEMDTVFSDGLAFSVGQAIVVRVVLERLRELGVDGLRVFVRDETREERLSHTWLTAARASSSNTGAFRGRRNALLASHPEYLRPILPHLVSSADETAGFLSDSVITHVTSDLFLFRVTNWLASRLPIGLEDTLAMLPPAPEFFASLSPHEPADSRGRWLWERFTITDLGEWATSSLVYEWEWLRSSSSAICDPRALNERRTDGEQLTVFVMERRLETHATRLRRSPDINADNFVDRASQLLIDGEMEKASQIFEGLLELAPGDSRAWNNFAFCVLPIDPDRAAGLFERSAALDREGSFLGSLNRVLALHLAGRDEEALLLADRALLGDRSEEAQEAYVWHHPSEVDAESDLELVLASNLVERLSELRVHISSGQCVPVR